MSEWGWAVIAIVFIVIVFALYGYTGSKQTYVCSKCGHEFNPSFLSAMLSLERKNERLLGCPKCKHLGYMKRK